jgi:hypothetical protein
MTQVVSDAVPGPEPVRSRLRRNRGRSTRVRPPSRARVSFALLAALYIGLRVVSFAGVAVVRYPDSTSYLAVAKEQLHSWAFWAGARPWTVPLLYKVLPDSDAGRSAGQLVISLLCWLALATATARCVRHERLRVVAFAVVLLFSLSPSITRWDSLILTESLSVSLTAAVMAAWLTVMRLPRPSALSIASVLVVTLLWTFARDTNAVLVMLVALLVLVWVIRPGPKAGRIVLLTGLVAIAGASLASTTSAAAKLRRVERPMVGAVGLRVLADPDLTEYFRHHGMPAPTPRVRANAARLKGIGEGLPTDGETEVFLDWVRAHGRSTLGRYLLTHPRAATLPLFTHNADLADESGGYRPPGARPIVPPVLRSVVYPGPGEAALAVAAAVLLAAVVVARRSRARRAWAVPVVALLMLIPYASLLWHGDAFEVSRHAFLVQMVLRLCPLLLGVFLIDARLDPVVEQIDAVEHVRIDTTPITDSA